MTGSEEAMALGQERIPETWNNIATGYDEFVTPSHMWLANEALHFAGLERGMRFLDVAAGSGALSIPAARLGAQVLATDASPSMLERLRMRANKEGLSNIESRVMNGHALELEDNTFDMSGSQFGVMLFPDMPRGISELARVTKPGGRVLMVAFGRLSDVEFFNFFIRALQAAVPGFTGPSTDPPPLPFQLQDPERLRRELTKAGLKDIELKTVTEKLEFRSAEHMWDWLTNSNPIAGTILANINPTEEDIAVIQRALDSMLRERSGGNQPRYPDQPCSHRHWNEVRYLRE